MDDPRVFAQGSGFTWNNRPRDQALGLAERIRKVDIDDSSDSDGDGDSGDGDSEEDEGEEEEVHWTAMLLEDWSPSTLPLPPIPIIPQELKPPQPPQPPQPPPLVDTAEHEETTTTTLGGDGGGGGGGDGDGDGDGGRGLPLTHLGMRDVNQDVCVTYNGVQLSKHLILAGALPPLKNLFQISDISREKDATITTVVPHPFINGDRVRITRVAGMAEVNGHEFTVTADVINACTFRLAGVDSSR